VGVPVRVEPGTAVHGRTAAADAVGTGTGEHDGAGAPAAALVGTATGWADEAARAGADEAAPAGADDGTAVTVGAVGTAEGVAAPAVPDTAEAEDAAAVCAASVAA
jgi:hypothetical protein